MTDVVDFVEHLRRQLGFLQRSCASYDAGIKDEAIRIATIVRVLVHDTARSTSLLKHLNATTINLLSTTRGASPQTIAYIGLGMTRLGGGKEEYIPELGDGPPQVYSFMPVSRWWNLVVMVLDRQRITRKDIVLAAANKDGGAHVDSNLTDEYKALTKDGAVGCFVYETLGNRLEAPIRDAHLVSLRQIGYELLHSPELTNLVS